MRTFAFILLIAVSLSLAGCKEAQNDEDTEVSINLNGNDGEASISSDGSSSDGKGAKLSIKSDGFNMNIEVPDIDIDADVGEDEKLYPGSKVTGVDINANSQGDMNSTRVNISFTSPASPDAVARHMADKIAKEGGKASISGNKITGTDEDGKAFTVTLDGSGNETKGVLNIDA